MPPEIVYGGDSRFAPYEFLDDKGNPAGLNVDLILAVARTQGWSVRCQMLPWREVRAGLDNGQIDVVSMYRSSPRARIADFAIAHEFVYHELFVRRGAPSLSGLLDLAGKKVIVESDTILVDALVDLGFEKGIVEVASEPDALRSLADGLGDVAIVTQVVGRPFRQREALASRISVTGPPVLLTEYGFATRKGRRDMIEQLNAGVAAVKASGEYDRIYRRWLHPDESGDLLRYAAWALAVLGALAALVVAWNYMLRRQVARQVKALVKISSSYDSLAAKQAEVDRANKELEAFSYSVSHDLRAPLRAIDGYTRILLEDHNDKLDAEGQRVCSVIRENVHGMGQLIDDLLNFSRLSRAVMEPTAVDMQALAESEFDRAAAPDSPARQGFHLSALPPVVGDPRLLRQVWANLLSNAIKFSARRERPSIHVSAESTATEHVYTVRDNGAGFDMRFAGKLFGVFQRLHSAREFEGTGVGLAIVQRVVERHGGRVWAEGEIDRGAAFHVALPKPGATPQAR